MVTNYTALDAVAFSIEVYNRQGFIKSGGGYSKQVISKDGNNIIEEVEDNKTVINNMMNANSQPNSDHLKQAQILIDKINGKLMLKKITNTLSSFEDNMIKVLNEDLSKFAVSIIASMPHSMVIDKKRQELAERLATIKHHSNFYGRIGTRYEMEAEVIDTKFIQKASIYMITTLVKTDLVKFWWKDQPDISDIIDGKTISIRGTVKSHGINRFNDAKETMLNRVKIALTK